MQVSVSRAGVPKLIASNLCITWGRSADKGKVVTPTLSWTWSRGKKKHFDISVSENYCVILSLWVTFIIYHNSKSNRLIIVFPFNTAFPSLPGARCCGPGNCTYCDPELFCCLTQTFRFFSGWSQSGYISIKWECSALGKKRKINCTWNDAKSWMSSIIFATLR